LELNGQQMAQARASHSSPAAMTVKGQSIVTAGGQVQVIAFGQLKVLV
jgi:hypothetical protein